MPKKKKAGDPTWGDVANASKANGTPRGAQTRLDLGDAVPEFHELDLEVPVSAKEAEILDRDASSAHARAKVLEGELEVFIAEHVGPKKAKIKELRKEGDDKAAESAARKRIQKQRVEVVYYPNTATVRFFEPGTARKVEVMLSRAMTPAEMVQIDDRPAPALPPDGDRVILDEPDAASPAAAS